VTKNRIILVYIPRSRARFTDCHHVTKILTKNGVKPNKSQYDLCSSVMCMNTKMKTQCSGI